ncbi:helix-turn-helix transcriptional regulator [Bacillus sp. CH126_4D]|uniref:helix-turn-helix domain-containing protein n=1 Tax=unclassified Bacillus (in: firmicutes) TaxID=185979 RepID=UPI00124C51F8|nr:MULTISPECIES: helix-turn-helix transcriptional regulator [unclassified Bacillus (in: firmicutes)]KAB2460615.1 helix-turn-helix transcriptional regulator [Bacillus sp. CH140a_4T]KAB2468502.1 helix-turn-helix transcriptional regulator [Bacillus sp. CH126_4D]
MGFGEKLFKLRKEKGLSQEALAEKLNTTRQAVSKWENGQGFPETEKLIMIGNVFEVSLDYLLKETAEQSNENVDGYYVSKEMAEGYIVYGQKISKYIALGFSLLILSTIPYLLFKEDATLSTFLVIIIAVLGIGAMMVSATIEESRYNVLKKEALLFDQNFLKELTKRYAIIKKKYAAVMIIGFCFIAAGAIPFLLEKKHITSGELVQYHPYCVVLIAIGVYLFVRVLGVLEAYRILVENKEYSNRLIFKLKKKVREKVDNF